jgi:hypothetical protein
MHTAARHPAAGTPQPGLWPENSRAPLVPRPDTYGFHAAGLASPRNASHFNACLHKRRYPNGPPGFPSGARVRDRDADVHVHVPNFSHLARVARSCFLYVRADGGISPFGSCAGPSESPRTMPRSPGPGPPPLYISCAAGTFSKFPGPPAPRDFTADRTTIRCSFEPSCAQPNGHTGGSAALWMPAVCQEHRPHCS